MILPMPNSSDSAISTSSADSTSSAISHSITTCVAQQDNTALRAALYELHRERFLAMSAGGELTAAQEAQIQALVDEDFGATRAKQQLLLAFVDEAVAGRCVISKANSEVTYLQKLYVRPQYRRRGVATALLHEAENFSAAHGEIYLIVDTIATLQAACALYRKLGFKLLTPAEVSTLRAHSNLPLPHTAQALIFCTKTH